MIAADIARALGGASRSGGWWRARCPVHNSRVGTLSLRDGDRGLMVHCHAGCESREIYAELCRRGLVEDRSERSFEPRPCPPRVEDDSPRIAMARRLWAAGQDVRGSAAERYLRSRGIELPLPPCVRWVPACRHPSGRVLPAMLARIDNVDGELIGIHRTYLRPDGSGKSDVEPAKAMLGRAAGGAVRLATAAETLMVGEGIENSLAAMQSTGMSAWAGLSAGGIEALVLPPIVRRVIIAADHDCNGRGEKAARIAADRWLAEGRLVRIPMPPVVGTDFDDLLLMRGQAGGMCDVAA